MVEFIYYFEVNKTKNAFVTVKANLVALDAHKLTIEYDSMQYIMECAYDLLKLKIGNILLVYADFPYPQKKGKRYQLYKLPQDFKYAPELSTIKAPILSAKDRSDVVDNHPDVRLLKTEMNNLIQQIAAELHQLQKIGDSANDLVFHSIIKFAKELEAISGPLASDATNTQGKTPLTLVQKIDSQVVTPKEIKKMQKTTMKHRKYIAKLFQS